MNSQGIRIDERPKIHQPETQLHKRSGGFVKSLEAEQTLYDRSIRRVNNVEIISNQKQLLSVKEDSKTRITPSML